MLAIAHRTPRTAADCQRLAESGAAVFEIDLQFMAGVPVVSHYLPPWRGMPLLRHDRWRITLRSRTSAEEDMAAVLDRVPPGCAVLVDLKTEDVLHATALVELLAAAGRPPEGWYVSGKDAGALAVVAASGYRTWLSVSTRPEFVGALNGQLPPGLDAIAVRHTYLEEATVGRLRQHQPRVIAWTVDKPYRAEELADLGVAGITSDNPAVHRFVASR